MLGAEILAVVLFVWAAGFVAGVLNGPSVLRRVTGRKKTERFVVKYHAGSNVVASKYDEDYRSKKVTYFWAIWDNLEGSWHDGNRHWETEEGCAKKAKTLNRLHRENRIVV